MTEQHFSDITTEALYDIQKRLWLEGDQVGLGHANELLLAQVQSREGVTTDGSQVDAAPETQITLEGAYELQGEAFRTHNQVALELANTAVLKALESTDDPRP